MPPHTERSRIAKPIALAVQDSPVLAQLQQTIAKSQLTWCRIQHVLPVKLREAVQAGPIDDTEWSLFVKSSAVASKLRQLVPEIENQLSVCGFGAIRVRIKILGHDAR